MSAPPPPPNHAGAGHDNHHHQNLHHQQPQQQHHYQPSAQTPAPHPTAAAAVPAAAGAGGTCAGVVRDGAQQPTPIIEDGVRTGVPHPRLEKLWQPQAGDQVQRDDYKARASTSNVKNDGFAALDLMVGSLPAALNVRDRTRNYTRTTVRDFDLPSVPPRHYKLTIDPTVHKETRQRIPLFPLGDDHARNNPFLSAGLTGPLQTVVLRVSTDSAVLPRGDASFLADDAHGPLFTRYMLPPPQSGNDAIHHCLDGWHIASNTTQRVFAWMEKHIPTLVGCLSRLVGEVCGIPAGADLPTDLRAAVLVHLAEERVDM